MRAVPASVALLACLSLVAGCGADEPADDPTPRAGVTTTPPATPDDPATAAPTTTAPSANPTPTVFATLADRLVPTAEVPGLNEAWAWQDGDTGPAGEEPFGICAQVDLLSIGASEVVERRYFPPDDSDDHAAQQVAEFPDAQTALRAWEVQAAWRKRCGRTMSVEGAPQARRMTPVPVPAGEARWYLVTSQPTGEESGRFDAVGLVRNGTRMTVLVISNSGQDYNYPPGEEPMVGMVEAAAARLG